VNISIFARPWNLRQRPCLAFEAYDGLLDIKTDDIRGHL
jgi:hypothetical protein